MSEVAGGMLDTGLPSVEVLAEYARACRQLGHPTPDPAQLLAAYTAEQGMDLQALDDDARALSAAVTAAEEVLALQERARRALAAAWRGAGAEAAADHLLRHADAAHATVDALRGAATALGELRNRLWQLIDAKVDTAVDVEARGLRTQWLSAARTVTTGAGDRAGASELVDLQVAPFVADDIGGDWVSAMRDTESAIRQAYSTAVSALTAAAPVMFDSVGALGPSRALNAIPVATEQVYRPGGAAAGAAPAGYTQAPILDPAPAAAPQGATVAGVPAAGAPAVITPSAAGPPTPAAMPGPEPMATPPMASPGGLGGGMSPLGSGLSGISGAGQSVADILGGLLGSGADLSGAGLGDADDLDPLPEDGPADTELEDDEDDEDDGEDDDGDDEAPAGDEPKVGEVVVDEPPVEADAAAAEEPVEPIVTEPVPTPVPEPMAEPLPAAPAEPAPADTPCEIAADELPQAGP